MIKLKIPNLIYTLIILIQLIQVKGWIPRSAYGEDFYDEGYTFPEVALEGEILANETNSISAAGGNSSDSKTTLLGDKLILTQIMESIEKGKTGKSDLPEVEYVWRDQARVTNLTDTRSYSGFFTVNKEYNSNLFFWFFPSAFEPETAPLIVWLNGGPGTSSLFGLFVENGPFKINNEGYLEFRQYAWTLTNSVIYIDSPVGTGFSFTDDPRGFSKNQAQVSDNLYEALVQFFRVFPEYQQRDLYIAGESYAGKYVPSLSYKIHIENENKFRQLKMNLKGVMIGSGFSDPSTQNQYGDFLYNLGLIDNVQKSYFLKEEDRIRKLIKNEEWEDATETVQSLILGQSDSSSFFHNVTGYKFYMNMLDTQIPQEYKNYVSFLNSESVRQSIHVGDQPFARGTRKVLQSMKEDICKSSKPQVERLLSLNYRVLLYSSQLDVIVPHTGIDRFINSLQWPGSKQYSRSPRRIWQVNGQIAGYTKFARNLAHVFIRNAGHVAPYDQPLWTYDMITRFTRGKSF